jgi:hypothetical protein
MALTGKAQQLLYIEHRLPPYAPPGMVLVEYFFVSYNLQ